MENRKIKLQPGMLTYKSTPEEQKVSLDKLRGMSHDRFMAAYLIYPDVTKKAMQDAVDARIKAFEDEMIGRREEFEKQIMERFVKKGDFPTSYTVTVCGETLSTKLEAIYNTEEKQPNATK